MPVTIEAIFLMRDGFTAPMDWNDDIIGLNIANVNVQIAASGAAIGSMPADIPVNITVIATTGASHAQAQGDSRGGFAGVVLPKEVLARLRQARATPST